MHVFHRAVEFSFRIWKDPQTDDLVDEICSVRFDVGGSDAQQHDQSGPNLADLLIIRLNAGFADSLNDNPHSWLSFALRLLAHRQPYDKDLLVGTLPLGYDPPMYPVLLHLGPITIYSYGVMMALGFISAGWTLGREFQRRGKDPNLASTFVLWAAIGGLMGARLLFVLQEWRAFLDDPWSLLFTGAGFVWYGGLLGGIVGVSLCIRRYGLLWGEMMDAVAPSIALGHGVGRIGCHLAGDGDWGPPTTLPWGVAYPNAIVGWDFPPGVYVHPTPLYETTAYLLVFAFLWMRRAQSPRPGTQFGWYLVLASTARFFLEFVRVNPSLAFGFSQAQVLSVFLVFAGAFLVLRDRETSSTATAAEAQVSHGKRR